MEIDHFKVQKTFSSIHRRCVSNPNDFCKYPMRFLLHEDYSVDHLAEKDENYRNVIQSFNDYLIH